MVRTQKTPAVLYYIACDGRCVTEHAAAMSCWGAPMRFSFLRARGRGRNGGEEDHTWAGGVFPRSYLY